MKTCATKRTMNETEIKIATMKWNSPDEYVYAVANGYWLNVCVFVCSMCMCLTDHKNSHYASEPGRRVLRTESETNPNEMKRGREGEKCSS